MQRDLRPLFFPKSVAVVGASSRPSSLAGAVLRNLVAGRFPGTVQVVHPKESEVHGVRAVAGLEDLDPAPEMAVIGVAPDKAEAAILHLLERGTRAFVLLTAGFGETGPEGRARELSLAARCRERGAVLMGSNCMGLHCVTETYRLDASFSRVTPAPGHVALISQSGSIGEWLFLRMTERRIGAAFYASAGNMADLTVPDLLEGVASLLPGVEQVLLYLETIPPAARLREAAAALRPGVRLMVVRGGTTGSGSRAVGGHTGALAAEPALSEALMRGIDAEEIYSLTETMDLIEVIDRLGAPRGRRVALVTNAGGPAVLAADELARMGIELGEISGGLQAEMRTALPMAAVTANPVDLLASAGPEEYRHALQLLSRSGELDALLPMFMHPIVTDAHAVARVFAEVLAGAPVPSVPCFMVAPVDDAATETIRDAGLPVIGEPNRAARALARWAQPPSPDRAEWPSAGDRRWPSPAPSLGGSIWGDPAVLEGFLASSSASTAESGRCAGYEEARMLVRAMRAPLALKIERGSDPHKARAGLLAMARTDDEAEAALNRLRTLERGGDRWLVQRLVPRGFEIYASFLRHPELGPFVGLARGGSAVERGAPPVWLSLPASAGQAEAFFVRATFLRELGEADDPGPAAARALVAALARLAGDAPEATMAEVNPAIWDPDAERLVLVDVRWQLSADR